MCEGASVRAYVWACACVCKPSCLDVAIEVSLALYLLEFPDVRYWNIDLVECLAFTPLWFHLYAHTADARFTQQYTLQMWQYMRDRDQIKLTINVLKRFRFQTGFHTKHQKRLMGDWGMIKSRTKKRNIYSKMN